MEGIVDRFEEDRVVLEVDDKMLILKKTVFPDEIKEGDVVVFKDGKFKIDKEKSKERKEYIDDLFGSLIDKED